MCGANGPRYRHVFLRAMPGVGKTTLIRKALAGLGNIRIGGFCTYFGPDREAPERSLYMRRAGEEAVYDQARVVARFSASGAPEAYLERFNEFGRAYIDGSRGNSNILVFDECSWLESRAGVFQSCVLSALDGDVPVIGVYRVREGGTWTERIGAHPRVRVVDITLENRDALAVELTGYFREALAVSALP